MNFSRAQVAMPQTQTVATHTTSSTVNVIWPMCSALVEIQLNGSVSAPLPTAQVMPLPTAIVMPNEATKIASSAPRPARRLTGR